MKNVLKSILITALLSFSAFGQDTIQLRNGETINANIIELTSTTVRYRRVDQPEGPIRNVELTDIAEITYEDGSKERFVLVEKQGVGTEERPVEQARIYPKRRGLDRIPEDKDRILEGGLFVDILPGFATDDYFSTSYMGMGARLGQKWYFGKGEKRRHGLQATWIRIHTYPIVDGESVVYNVTGVFSPLGIGSTNVFKFKEKRGLEVNASVAPVILEAPFVNSGSSRAGIMYGLTVKYRHDRLAIGLDISRAHLRNDNLNMLSVTAGFKF